MWIFTISPTFCTPTLTTFFIVFHFIRSYRVTPTSALLVNASHIYLALVSNLPQLHKCSIVPPLANSDHSGLEMSTKWRNIRRPATSSKRVVWKYAQVDFGKACSLIEGTNWDALVNNNIDVSLKNWQNRFLSIIEECIPNLILPRRRNLPLMSKNLLRAMRKQNSLYRQARKH